MTKEKPAFRLAMRVEGQNWVAYCAQPDTMEGAIFLGSIAMRFVEDRGRKHVFMELMRDAISDIFEEHFGERPAWGVPQKAPESERGGNA